MQTIIIHMKPYHVTQCMPSFFSGFASTHMVSWVTLRLQWSNLMRLASQDQKYVRPSSMSRISSGVHIPLSTALQSGDSSKMRHPNSSGSYLGGLSKSYG